MLGDHPLIASCQFRCFIYPSPPPLYHRMSHSCATRVPFPFVTSHFLKLLFKVNLNFNKIAITFLHAIYYYKTIKILSVLSVEVQRKTISNEQRKTNNSSVKIHIFYDLFMLLANIAYINVSIF